MGWLSRLLLPNLAIEALARTAGWAAGVPRPRNALSAEERVRARLMGLRDGHRAARIGRHVVIDDPARLALGPGARLGAGVTVILGARGRCSIGAGAHVMHGSVLAASGGIEIGARAGISSGVTVYSVTHGAAEAGAEPTSAPAILAPVRIGRGAHIGAGAVILPGVAVGDRARLGAGAVAARDVPDGATAVGVPARVKGAG